MDSGTEPIIEYVCFRLTTEAEPSGITVGYAQVHLQPHIEMV